MATTKKALSTKKKPSELLDELIIDVQAKRDQAKSLNEDIKTEQAEVLDLMERLGLDSHMIKLPNGKTVKATRIQATSTVIDEPKLKKRLGLALWNKVSTRTLDKKKLEAYIASGEVKVSVVAECSTDKTNAPFVKVT